MLCRAVILLITCLVLLNGCEDTLERICYICPETCPEIPVKNDHLIFADFENAGPDLNYGGYLDCWSDTISDIRVRCTVDSTGGGAQNSKYYARIEISGNDGDSPPGWTGGGPLITLSCRQDVDLQEFKFLQFDIKTDAIRLDRHTRIKLEDSYHNQQPQRIIPLSESWSTVRFPIDHFTSIQPPNPRKWKTLETTKVARFVITVVHNGSIPYPLDGTIFLDNIMVSKI